MTKTFGVFFCSQF